MNIRAERLSSTRAVGAPSDSALAQLRHQAHVVRVLAGTEFKLKYADSVLGYFWSLVKPMALFSVLYVIFGRLLRLGSGLTLDFPLFLLLGIVLYTYFAETTSTTMTSIVSRGSLIRKLAFPRLIIPVSTSLTAFTTFGINVVVVAAFIAWKQIIPRPDWIFLLPLLVEVYLFSFGISLILATLFVRFRDVGQIWELAVQLLIYATPVIYPMQLLPEWGQRLVFLNPLSQIIQDARAVLLHADDVVTIPAVYGSSAARLIPFSTVIVVLLVGLVLFKREERWFAERV